MNYSEAHLQTYKTNKKTNKQLPEVEKEVLKVKILAEHFFSF